LKINKADNPYLKEITRIGKQELLILGDLSPLPSDAQSRVTLMKIIEDRHGKRSTINASLLHVHQWHDIIGESTIADAIPDRLDHDAHRMELIGESLLKKSK